MSSGPQPARPTPADSDTAGAGTGSEPEDSGNSAAQNAAAGASSGGRRRIWSLASRWLARLVFLASGVPLFLLYLRLSQTAPVNSDGASNVLQGWDMLHGNLLLHGWSMSDVSFYTTDLPQYAIVDALHGLGPDVVHIVSAATYTAIVLLCVALARGRATGLEAATRMLITAGIMLAPQPPQYSSNGVPILLSSADHVATAAPVLAAWLVLDRAGRRWWGPVAAALLVGWALTGDTLALYTGVAPLLAIGAALSYRKLVVQHQPLRSACWELSLVAAGAGGGAMAMIALRLIRAHHGFVVWGPTSFIVTATTLPRRLLSTAQDVLGLFGADGYGTHPGGGTVVGLVHLVGLCLAAWGAAAAVRHFWRDADVVAQLLVAGVVFNLGAYLGAISLSGAREIAAVLPFGAVLAGRMLGARIVKARLVPVLGVLLVGYAIAFGHGVTEPAVPAQGQHLTSFLAAHRLRYGLAGYWQSSVATVASGNRVQVRPVSTINSRIAAYRWHGKHWEELNSWYNPRLHDATFLVTGVVGYQPDGAPEYKPAETAALASFGKPAHIYRFGLYEVLVWNENLLDHLGPGPPLPPALRHHHHHNPGTVVGN
jgi:hypothetical protein